MKHLYKDRERYHPDFEVWFICAKTKKKSQSLGVKKISVKMGGPIFFSKEEAEKQLNYMSKNNDMGKSFGVFSALISLAKLEGKSYEETKRVL